jgi:hypothetical protein
MRTYLSANTVHTQPSARSVREGEEMNERHDAARDRENTDIKAEHERLGWR